MSQTEDQDKSHAASAKKLADARQKGDIPRSNEANTAIVFSSILMALIAVGPKLTEIFVIQWSNMYYTIKDANILVAPPLLRTLAPIFGMLVIPILCLVVFVTIQRAWIITPKNVKPDLKRISPLANAKQKFGPSGLVDFIKNIARIGVVIGIAWWISKDWGPDIINLASFPLLFGLRATFSKLMWLLMGLGITFVLFSALDFGLQWRKFMNKMRMSHQEIKDETKDAEGDPFFKQNRRQKAIQIANSANLANIKKADVIIVNPTHYAVALAWDRCTTSAPICVSKGIDDIALKIRETAGTQNIPIHSDPPTARAIYATVDLGQAVLPEHYAAVAAAIQFADHVREKSKNARH